MGVPRKPFELGASEASSVPCLMVHDDYRFEFEEWIREEGEQSKQIPRRKRFIGDRSYRHFDARVSLKMLESGEAAQLIAHLKNPTRLISHSFFPFLRRDKKVRRFIREVNAETGINKPVAKQKLRPIMYASHKDAVVYGFYGYILKKLYDERIRELGIADNVIAYRRIPREDGSERNKSNIDFAHDIYKMICGQKEIMVMCLDIKDFFGSMQHVGIYKRWSTLLGLDELPMGHKIVYRNITRYRYLFLTDVLQKLKIASIIKGRLVYAKGAQRVGPIGSPQLYNSQLNNSEFIRINKSPKGIPQGSPISDILANIYLTEFDVAVKEFLDGYGETLYRRYSDDIIMIFPPSEKDNVYEFITKLLTEEGLQVSSKKTELFYINRQERVLKDVTGLVAPGYALNKRTVQYLGFEFDLDGIHIRSGTIANHYRKLVRSLKKDVDLEEKSEAEYKKKSRKRDRYAYIKLASKRIGDARLLSQHKNVRKRTRRLKQQAAQHQLNTK